MKNPIANRKFLEHGQVLLTPQAVHDAMRSAQVPWHELLAQTHQDIDQYLHWAHVYDLPAIATVVPDVDHAARQQQWSMPDQYMHMDIVQHLQSLCCNDMELQRINMELAMYAQRDALDLLKYVKYLVDIMDKHNIISGVGRGSSCASYCLYKLGLHHVDSLAYDIDIHEFLK